ncbi:hypothetical protein LK08_29165 [Streptomyces sp. MUSC 125]|uniref:hypothetical protein n=1 Tax=unclassified Streptomyces TaxID=2593676 RepID=UPI00057C890F|nr:hypothetical protein LK08_29165 [Streptomyces sp. MUSC 125]
MRLLVIGGTVFLGKAFVAGALARGWEVTTFHRGRSGADLPGVETITGDRENEADLARLAAAGPWDFSSKKALEAGLRCRPFAESVRDTWTWMTEQGGMEEAFAEYRYPDQTLTREREAQILAAWDARESG